jgi:hypothetical protein
MLKVNTKVSRQAKAQVCSIQGIGCSPMTDESPSINRSETVILSMDEIGNYDVAVKMRVSRTADSMRKPSGRHSLNTKHVSLLREGVCSLDAEGSLLEVSKCHLKCFMVHIHYRSSLIMIRRRKEDADALWRGKDRVVANATTPLSGHQRASRWSAFQDAREILGVNCS